MLTEEKVRGQAAATQLSDLISKKHTCSLTQAHACYIYVCVITLQGSSDASAAPEVFGTSQVASDCRIALSEAYLRQ